MKVVMCWPVISGYMAACWRAMSAHEDVDLFVLARRTGGAINAFSDDIMQGVPCELREYDEKIDYERLVKIVSDQKPDVVSISGWDSPVYRRLVFAPELRGVRFIMSMDTPYQGTLRQHLGRFRHPRYFKRIDRVFVTGERCFQLARTLGFDSSRINRGVYGVDFEKLSALHEQRAALDGGWPRRFISTGQYVERKGVRTLLKAYQLYRSQVSDPWSLTFCGKGPLEPEIEAAEGVENRGFVQPADLLGVMLQHGAFVLASEFDPWPLAVVEACAAGLPVVCTEECGSHVELLRFCTNGRTVQAGSAQDLARALRWMHDRTDAMPEMGAASVRLASAYSAQMWALRWATVCRELTESGPRSS